MHKVAEPRNAADAPIQTPPAAERTAAARVAVAGATGYTGQELLRLLARHPAVTIAAAMSSAQAGSATPAPPGPGATPGCYPTAALLALTPLVEAGLLVRDADIIVDAKSGVSGAGKKPTERTHFSEVHGSLGAYGVFNHRHGTEIEQGVGRTVTFTPHLVPIDRGILATIYVRVAPGTTEEQIADVLEQAYRGATFVRLVGSRLAEIKHVAHTNCCAIR